MKNLVFHVTNATKTTDNNLPIAWDHWKLTTLEIKWDVKEFW